MEAPDSRLQGASLREFPEVFTIAGRAAAGQRPIDHGAIRKAVLPLLAGAPFAFALPVFTSPREVARLTVPEVGPVVMGWLRDRGMIGKSIFSPLWLLDSPDRALSRQFPWMKRRAVILDCLGQAGMLARQAGAFALAFSGRQACVLAAPLCHYDAEGRRHCTTGPAVWWEDGTALWFLHDVPVPQHAVEAPERITLAEIDGADNAELQRVLIERFGWERFGAETQATVVDHDDRWGTLMQRGDADGRPLLFVTAMNRSPEPDGTFRRYVLPVHPMLRPIPDHEAGEQWFGPAQRPTALNAVASTFGMTGPEYAARLGAES